MPLTMLANKTQPLPPELMFEQKKETNKYLLYKVINGIIDLHIKRFRNINKRPVVFKAGEK